MNKAEEFFQAFLKQNPEIQKGQLSFNEINERLNKFQDIQNNRALDDFDGLSPVQMGALLYNPFSKECILQLRETGEQYIDEIPLFQLSEILVAEIEKPTGLKLTAKGNLPVSICELLLKQNLIKWKYMEHLSKVQEAEIPYAWPLKQYLLDLGIVKKMHNKLLLTKYGMSFLKKSKKERLTALLIYFGSHFHWGNFYRVQDGGRAGQLGWAFSVWLLHKYGDKPRNSEFYSTKIIEAFETGLKENITDAITRNKIDEYHHAYAYRFFENFANWFGLVNIERRKVPHRFRDQLIITKTKLYDDLFQNSMLL